MDRAILHLGPRIRRTLLLAVLFGVPLLFLQGVTHDAFNVPKLALLVAGTAVAAAIRIAEGLVGGLPLRWRPLAVPAGALLIPLALSWTVSPYRGWAIFGDYSRFMGLLPYLTVAAFGVLVADAFRGRALQVAWALAASGAVVGGYSLIQMLGLDPVPQLVNGIEIATNISTIGHTNFTAGFMAVTLPLCIYLWVRAPRYGLVAAGLTVLTGAGIVLTFSQGGWAAAAAGTALVTGFLIAERHPAARVVGLCAVAAVAVVLVGSVVLSLVLEDSAVLGGTIRTRGYLWGSAVGLAAEAPIVGRGPNSYAIEGVRHRPLPSALSEEYATADDPHSVPLAFLANAGVLGLIGWLVMVAWAVRTGWPSPLASLQGAFFAALVAYLVQALVSIDVVSLRVALWGVLGGLVAARDTAEGDAIEAPPRPRRRTATLVAASALVLTAVGAGYWATGWVLADIRVQRGMSLVAEGAVDAGRSEFERALAFRDEPEYRRIYASQLAVAALTKGPSGAPLIDEMRRVDSYLDRFPETNSILSSATLLHYWGTFASEGDSEALILFRRALRYDPYNPLIRAQISEVLIDLNRDDEALEFLEATTDWYRGAAPEYWGALATARLVSGDETGADLALEHGIAINPNDCRIRIAQELLAVAQRAPGASPPSGAGFSLVFTCNRGLYDLFLDRLPSDVRSHYG